MGIGSSSSNYSNSISKHAASISNHNHETKNAFSYKNGNAKSTHPTNGPNHLVKRSEEDIGSDYVLVHVSQS